MRFKNARSSNNRTIVRVRQTFTTQSSCATLNCNNLPQSTIPTVGLDNPSFNLNIYPSAVHSSIPSASLPKYEEICSQFHIQYKLDNEQSTSDTRPRTPPPSYEEINHC
ncbi:DgyrCDS10826 [Dimorphilus gyrociliatus]|uniref:DgyrCDS10826 n=1 Tax=Dimorphilus gyrociliatus TaxID=2664684 RepID=A0A7I8W402_9ANNE|nr:DgyrCDS10826 [Dimorphilus gyrociliatus]